MLSTSNMKYYFLILLTLLTSNSFGQTDSVLVKNKGLKIVKYHPVKMEYNRVEGKTTYKINGKSVDSSIYSFYQSEQETIRLCTPCIVEAYDLSEKLMFRAVQFRSCPIGDVTLYYTNGKIRFTGQYKENQSGDWEDIWNKGYCAIKHGNWYFYRKNGKLRKKEKYVNGQLVK